MIFRKKQAFKGNTCSGLLFDREILSSKKIEISCTTEFYFLIKGKKSSTYLAGQKVNLLLESNYLRLFTDAESSSSIEMTGFEIYSEYVDRSSSNKGRFQINGLWYEGSLHIHCREGEILVGNLIALSKLLYSALFHQMPIDWPIEALKVQAIISRSIAFSGQKNSLPYSDLSSVYEKSILAVDETDGLVLSTHKKILKMFDDIDSSIGIINSYNISKIYDLALKGLSAEKILSQIFPEFQLAKIEIGCD